MRRAFTLIELLVIVAIIGTMVTVAVVSVQKGQEYARMRGTVRSVFATVRQARSIALVTQKPSIISFSTKRSDGEAVSRVEITSAKLMETKSGVRARSLTGEWRVLGDDEAPPAPVAAPAARGVQGAEAAEPVQDAGGKTTEEILFAPVSEEVLRGVCIKVVKDDEELVDSFSGADEVKRSRISVFSNADFLLQKFNTAKDDEKKKREAEAKAAGSAVAEEIASEDIEEDSKVVWQTNGRSEAHRIYIYPEGGTVEDAWVIRVDRFGGVKVLEDGEE